MKSCLFISVLAILSGMVAGLIREYVFYDFPLNWTFATYHCINRRYLGLAYISSTDENSRLMYLAGNSSGWIGLYRNNASPTGWLWYPGLQNDFYIWSVGKPSDATTKQDCVLLNKEGWSDNLCQSKFPFYCYRNIILVKEKMTWLDALQYCTSKYTGLACLNTDTRIQFAKIEAMPSETNSLWTGLRFLNGIWFWALCYEELGNVGHPPSCPASDYRCGARNFRTDAWENRHCEEKLNFLCY